MMVLQYVALALLFSAIAGGVVVLFYTEFIQKREQVDRSDERKSEVHGHTDQVLSVAAVARREHQKTHQELHVQKKVIAKERVELTAMDERNANLHDERVKHSYGRESVERARMQKQLERDERERDAEARRKAEAMADGGAAAAAALAAMQHAPRQVAVEPMPRIDGDAGDEAEDVDVPDDI